MKILEIFLQSRNSSGKGWGYVMSKVCVFFGAGFEEIEALTVVDILRRQGIETQMVSVMGQRKVMGSHQIPVETDALIEDVDFEQTDMLILPGGLGGTKNLEACGMLTEQVQAFVSAGKAVCAICAAPSILGCGACGAGRKHYHRTGHGLLSAFCAGGPFLPDGPGECGCHGGKGCIHEIVEKGINEHIIFFDAEKRGGPCL